MDEALEKAIAHWVDNVDRAKNGVLNRNHISGEYCALCDAYYDDESANGYECDKCPLYIAGYGCQDKEDSPYVLVAEALRTFSTSEDMFTSDANREKLVEACENMLTKLKELR